MSGASSTFGGQDLRAAALILYKLSLRKLML